ncbi:MAG: von Willebrand factor type domain [Acidobacteriota bacterium]|jgi:Mg-chelatase subunit ChlD|nr:von Willebrand factor type domain [Acidobacteriota bacterium]
MNINKLCAFALPLFVLGCAFAPDHGRASDETIAVHRTTPIDGIDLFVMMDESGSMGGPHGTDPNLLRYEAAKYLLQNVLVKPADAESPHQVAIIHFGSTAQSKGLLPLTPSSVNQVLGAIHLDNPASLGDTSFTSAFKLAGQIRANSRFKAPGRRTIAVIFTDGQPDDARKLSIEASFQELQHEANTSLGGAEFFVVGINNPTSPVKFSETVSRWQKVAGPDHVTRVERLDDLYAGYNEALRRVFEIPHVDEITVRGSQDFEVEPYLSALEFHIFTPSQVELLIRDPQHVVLSSATPGVTVRGGNGYRILSVQRPRPGQWHYEVKNGTGDVRVVRNPIPLHLDVQVPEPVYPSGKPFFFRAVFTDSSGHEVAEIPEYPLSLTARITMKDASNFEKQLRLLPIATGRGEYYGGEDTASGELRPITLSKAGTYEIVIRVKGGTKFEFTRTVRTDVRSLPYLDISQPIFNGSVPAGHAASITAQLRHDGAAIDPSKFFTDNPNDLVLAQVCSDIQGTSCGRAMWLSHKGNGLFGAAVPTDVHRGQNYAAVVRLKGSPRIQNAGMPAEMVETIPFHGALTSSQTATRIGIVIASIVMGWILLVLIRLTAIGPRYLGMVEASAGGQSIWMGHANRRVWWPKRARVSREAPMATDEEGAAPAQARANSVMSLWGRALARDKVRFYAGGWGSLLLLGLFSRNVNLSGTDQTELGDAHIEIQSDFQD